jgi:hypothetical protein
VTAARELLTGVAGLPKLRVLKAKWDAALAGAGIELPNPEPRS